MGVVIIITESNLVKDGSSNNNDRNLIDMIKNNMMEEGYEMKNREELRKKFITSLLQIKNSFEVMETDSSSCNDTGSQKNVNDVIKLIKLKILVKCHQ